MMNYCVSDHVREKFQYDAKQLLRELRSQSINKDNISNAEVDAQRHRKATLTACKKIIAKKYCDDLQRMTFELMLLQRFAQYNYEKRVWVQTKGRKWRASIHRKQIDALKMAEETGLSLSVCAKKLGVTFEYFHFSSQVLEDILFEIQSTNSRRNINLIDFSNLSAQGSFIESAWMPYVSSFACSDFQNAKFYHFLEDKISSGVNCFQADFSYANLSNADLRFSYLRESNFNNACLENTDFTGANIFDCNFNQSKGEYITTSSAFDYEEFDAFLRESSLYIST